MGLQYMIFVPGDLRECSCTELQACMEVTGTSPITFFRRRYVGPTCRVWSDLRSMPTCGGRHFAHTPHVGRTSFLDVGWRRRADVFPTSSMYVHWRRREHADVQKTSCRRGAYEQNDVLHTSANYLVVINGILSINKCCLRKCCIKPTSAVILWATCDE